VDAAAALARARLFSRERSASFEHPLLRTAVESELTPAERDRLHATAARLLAAGGAGAERVALHLAETAPRADVDAASVLAEAGRGALRCGAPEAAARLLRRALDESPPEAQRHELLFDLGRAGSELGDPQAIEHLKRVVIEAGDEALRTKGLALLDLAWITEPRPEANASCCRCTPW
jgi:hypothetical protein